MTPVIIIAGPTAVGKTDLAIRLAERLQAEIISADSMQVYKYMDIGTAKPTWEQQQRINHHLINLVEPNQDFSVADYQKRFDESISEIVSRGKLPLVVGGTGLYIRASLRSFPFKDPGADQNFRERLKKQAATMNDPLFLYQQLQERDPQAAIRIHPNDTRRIIRALEVYYQTGTPLTLLQTAQKIELKYQSIYLFLDRERTELYQRIEERVETMLKEGLVAETANLLEKGYSPELKSMQSLGYKQIIDYLQGKILLEQAITLTKQLTRNYAKRQLTWFRKEPVEFWVNFSNHSQEFFGEILSYIEGRLSQMSNNIS